MTYADTPGDDPRRRMPGLTLLALAASLAAGCGSEGNVGTAPGPTPPAPSYTLSLASDAISILQGGSGETVVNLARTNFTGAVDLEIEGPAAAGMTFSFNPDPVTGNRSTLTIDVDPQVPRGDFALTVRGTAPNLADRTASLAVATTVPCEAPSECGLRTEFGSVATLDVFVDDIFAVWWDPRFDHAADAAQITTQLKAIRRDCLDNLGMRDPPNPAAGYYYNVYIHHGPDDLFPPGWGNGQGTDSFGTPYLTLPVGAHIDPGNLYHEGFHIFQYSATSPGFAYSGDSQWYTESSANWFLAKNRPDDVNTFVQAGAMGANPQLALWHSFGNEAPGDPTDWLYQVRQYGMHTYLFYLTDVAGVEPSYMTDGFYQDLTLSPQEYHYTQVGGAALRGFFADWAAHNTGGYDYLTDEQVQRADFELGVAGDPDNLHPFVLSYVDAGTGGAWVRPPAELTARGWAYNVVRIGNSQAATYTFALDGDATGSEGAASRFEGRIVVMGPSGPTYSSLLMANDLDGSGVVTVTAADTELFLVIASVPEHFGGNQTYGYAVNIDRQ